MPKTRKPPYRIVDPSTLDARGGPRQLFNAARAAGFIVEVHAPRKPEGVLAVGGIRDIGDGAGLAFVATWVDGASIGCTLYSEVDEGYHEVPAPKTVVSGRGQDRRERITGYVSGTRLVYRGGPRGISLGVNDLKARMKAL